MVARHIVAPPAAPPVEADSSLTSWSRMHALAMFGASAASVVLHAPWPVGATALASFAVLLIQHRATWAGQGRTFVPNAVTALRLVLVVGSGVFLDGAPGTLWAAMIAGVFALDSVDGWLARRANGATAFGAHFDMETDALLILVVDLELWMRGSFGAWILTGGLLRYAYVLSVTLVPARGGEMPRSTLGRNAFGTLVMGLCAALVWPNAAGLAAAAIGTAAVTLSFARSFYWSYWRRADATHAP